MGCREGWDGSDPPPGLCWCWETDGKGCGMSWEMDFWEGALQSTEEVGWQSWWGAVAAGAGVAGMQHSC